jgi:hypothetical protein
VRRAQRGGLATPCESGFDLAAWLVPGATIVVAAVAIAIGLRCWRMRGDGGSAEPPSRRSPTPSRRESTRIRPATASECRVEHRMGGQRVNRRPRASRRATFTAGGNLCALMALRPQRPARSYFGRHSAWANSASAPPSGFVPRTSKFLGLA